MICALSWACLPAFATAQAQAQPAAAADYAPAETTATYKAWGGEIEFRWNRELMRDYGAAVSAGKGALKSPGEGLERFAMRDATSLDFAVAKGDFNGFRGGALSMRGGFDLTLADGTISLQELTLRPRAGEPFVLDVVSGDGKAWFYIDRLMYEIEPGGNLLAVKAMDLRMAPAFAERLGRPDYAGYVVASMRLFANVHGKDIPRALDKGVNTKWHGDPAPNGGTYQADVFMYSFNAQYFRKDAQANGPGGSDGRVVFVPSSTLSNNRNNGAPVATVSGDPLGTSSVPWTANVPWYTKFSGVFDPHRNDQHPFLIWNLYRIDGDGQLTQVARSGVKHAWLTTNNPCDEHPGSNHILGRGCRDTYGTGNNDEITDLGPRSEIVPKQGLWGRCTSVYDKTCDGNQDANAPCSNLGGSDCTNWAFRLQVHESEIETPPGPDPAPTFLFESWYIVRDDVNIFNTMQTRPVTFSWNNSTWDIGNGAAAGQKLGPAIDRWMPRGTNEANRRSTDIVRPEGEGRVAARVTSLGGGQYRYDYAVMNFDFAEAVLEQHPSDNPGTSEDDAAKLIVVSNDGFVAFHLPLPDGATVSDEAFGDHDNDPANDWTIVSDAQGITFTAPAGNALNWGTLYNFSFVADTPPSSAALHLATAQAGTPDEVVVATLGPSASGAGGFLVGGSVAGIDGSDGIELTLNEGTPLPVNADGGFLFPEALADGAAYEVEISRTPTNRVCEVTGGSGLIDGDDVLDVQVTCGPLPPAQVPVSGTVAGLGDGKNVGLRLNVGVAYAVSANGAFAFPQTVATGSNYTVTVATQPVGQQCTLENDTGVVPNGGVTDVQVTCADIAPTFHHVFVTVAGLAPATSVVVQLNGANATALQGDGSHGFGPQLQTGDAYEVTVKTLPQGQDCVLANPQGVINDQDITDIVLTCSALPPGLHVGGSVSGLDAGTDVSFAINGGEMLQRDANGAFVFHTALQAGDGYDVEVTAASGTLCTVNGGNGTLGAGSIANVRVVCGLVPPAEVFEDGFEVP